MITKNNLKTVLGTLGFIPFNDNHDIYFYEYENNAKITVNFKKNKIEYFPIDSSFKEGEFPSKEKPATGFIIHRDTTLNFSSNENFVCLICVHNLLQKGYMPQHIIFEPAFKVGHVNKPSYGDILVLNKEYNPLVLIENKTYGTEFSKEWNLMQKDGGQLFSYLGPLVNELGLCQSVILFAADFDDKNVIYKNHIITLIDNEKRITELNTQMTFLNAKGKYFQVWSETYGKSFETKGMFEKDIDPYTIGKQKYTISDLKELSHAEIKPIFHEFANILRSYAITDFEHSFYILIDLFLCKITDEINNPDDLQFYYKGITRDTPKDYCNRLLRLYKQGKKQLFDINVVNKEESDILQIFEDTNRTVTNGLFDGIKNLFEEIKFYTIKKFNFISVENKEDFELNFEILIKIAALIQDINLSNSETNHFFGDLFEGLLSKNVHQTEGQFFTPLPIVNFIINSLPEFPNSKEFKVLDYACGAGHFLTEFIKKYPNAQIYGIEKSQNLSQVAKIATIINGCKSSNIVFKDALSCIETSMTRYNGFDKESFDCIIANPPFSVDGFLDSITSEDRNQFELLNYVNKKAYDTNDSIECFFVERAHYFLKQYGLLGIVLPSSILTSGNIYARTRELIFNNFNILGIVNFNNKHTFGSTGTNTIVIFAQKVKKNATGLVKTFLNKKDITQYMSYQAIYDYIEKQNYNVGDYFSFMQDNILSDSLLQNEVFQEYRETFKPTKISLALQRKWFNNSSNVDSVDKKNYKVKFLKYLNSNEYKKEETLEYQKQFIEYSKEIEIDKLTTFIQITNNDVAILQSPPEKINNKSNKEQIVKFFGYDWSGARGNEGISYIVNNTSTIDISNKDDEDAVFIETVNSIKNIITPLYNPQNAYDNTKFSYAFKKHITEKCSKFSFRCTVNKNFVDNNLECPDLFYYENLGDLIDFNLASFDKKIKTVSAKKIEVKSHYPTYKLGKIADSWLRGAPLQKVDLSTDGKYPCIHYGELFTKYNAIILDIVSKTNKELNCLSRVGDILFAASDVTSDGLARCSAIMKCNIQLGSDIIVLRPKEEIDNIKINPCYLSFIINSQREQILSIITGKNVKHLSSTSLKNIVVPLPPIDIQEKVSKESQEILKEYKSTRMSDEEYKTKTLNVLIKNKVLL